MAGLVATETTTAIWDLCRLHVAAWKAPAVLSLINFHSVLEPRGTVLEEVLAMHRECVSVKP
jgi:hypothetical protein